MLLVIYTLSNHPQSNTARVIANTRAEADEIVRSWNLMEYVTFVSEQIISNPYIMLTYEPNRRNI